RVLSSYTIQKPLFINYFFNKNYNYKKLNYYSLATIFLLFISLIPGLQVVDTDFWYSSIQYINWEIIFGLFASILTFIILSDISKIFIVNKLFNNKITKNIV
ncbi:MAG: hypothetical protein LBD05_01490, partial [Mycoplasmataceae bacterium]|nr:hypothetical protein [Mycoplasmataceae bacterium]